METRNTRKLKEIEQEQRMEINDENKMEQPIEMEDEEDRQYGGGYGQDLLDDNESLGISTDVDSLVTREVEDKNWQDAKNDEQSKDDQMAMWKKEREEEKVEKERRRKEEEERRHQEWMFMFNMINDQKEKCKSFYEDNKLEIIEVDKICKRNTENIQICEKFNQENKQKIEEVDGRCKQNEKELQICKSNINILNGNTQRNGMDLVEQKEMCKESHQENEKKIQDCGKKINSLYEKCERNSQNIFNLEENLRYDIDQQKGAIGVMENKIKEVRDNYTDNVDKNIIGLRKELERKIQEAKGKQEENQWGRSEARYEYHESLIEAMRDNGDNRKITEGLKFSGNEKENPNKFIKNFEQATLQITKINILKGYIRRAMKEDAEVWFSMVEEDININEEYKEEVMNIIKENKELFDEKQGIIKGYQHKLEVDEEKHFKAKSYPIPHAYRKEVDEEIIMNTRISEEDIKEIEEEININEEYKEEVMNIIKENKELFDEKQGIIKGYQHKLEVDEEKHFKAKSYPIPHAYRKEVDEEKHFKAKSYPIPHAYRKEVDEEKHFKAKSYPIPHAYRKEVDEEIIMNTRISEEDIKEIEEEININEEYKEEVMNIIKENKELFDEKQGIIKGYQHNALQLEQNRSLTPWTYSLPFDNDCIAVETAVKELELSLASLKTDFVASVLPRFTTLWVHVERRCGLMTPTEDTEVAQKNKLLLRLQILFNEVEALIKKARRASMAEFSQVVTSSPKPFTNVTRDQDDEPDLLSSDDELDSDPQTKPVRITEEKPFVFRRHVTVDTLKREVAEAGVFTFGKTSLKALLHSIGFSFKKDDGRRRLFELEHIATSRIPFLRNYMKNKKLNEYDPVFLDGHGYLVGDRLKKLA
ncbi:hypothetical protein FQR65_LT15017 [Abscondita terminalis]|nr:hypothetical protein FQR65_LT15017 [Abscondita terminalis]